MATGDARGVSQQSINNTINVKLSEQRATLTGLKQALFGLNPDGSDNTASIASIDWDPLSGSMYLRNRDSLKNLSVLPNNWNYNGAGAASSAGEALVLVGTNASGNARYAMFGGHPFGVPGNAGMTQFMVNTVAWLSKRTSFSGFKIVVAQQSSGVESATRTWFAGRYSGITINGITTNPATQSDDRCDNANLNTCLQGADLLVMGQNTSASGYDGAVVMAAVSAAQSRGIPVLYTHSGWDRTDLTDRLMSAYNMSYANPGTGNYFSRYGLKGFVPSSLPSLPAKSADIEALVARLDRGTFSSTWSGCTTNVGKVSCSGDTTYVNEFDTTAKAIQSSLRTLESSGTAIFSQSGYELEKLLVLLGDKYRESTSYASTFTKTSAPLAFYRAFFSDLASYSLRSYNSVPQNLGNFSNLFPATTTTSTHTVTVTLPATGTKEYMTGLYVLPGRSVTLQRMDGGTGILKFGINLLRDTTRVFSQLDRPTNLSSPRPGLAAGASMTVTNPYGGPLYLFVDAASGQPSVSVRVEGVISHPVLRDATDPTAVASFNSEINSTTTNWVGITTGTLTLHSTLKHFRTSLSNYANNVGNLIADTWTYTIKGTYELAGFNTTAGNLTLPTPVMTFCAAKGWADCSNNSAFQAATQHRRDVMQHVISDAHALCGGGCSGNPYDQNWAFEPLGWGETHEIGHNLQRDRLKIYSGQSTEVSNNIFPLHKHIQFDRTNNASTYANDRSGSPASVFNTLKAAQGQSNPSTYVYNAVWSDTAYAANNSERLNFYRQLVEYARHYNTNFSDGWELYTLLYLLERNFSSSNANWASVAASYGFGNYTSFPNTVDGNDFMLVATSFIIGRDMTPVFDLWGITYNTAAATQAASHGTAAAKLFFPMGSLSKYGADVATPVTVTSSASYPAGF